jgi:hypothetical protein
MSGVTSAFVAVATAIVGIAILAVLVSKNAQTPAVISAAGSAFSGAINAATGPVSGSNYGSGFSNLNNTYGNL